MRRILLSHGYIIVESAKNSTNFDLGSLFVAMDKLIISALELTHLRTTFDALGLQQHVNIITEITVRKTNVLDALHYLSLTRSTGSTDSQNITHGESMALIKANLERKGAIIV